MGPPALMGHDVFSTAATTIAIWKISSLSKFWPATINKRQEPLQHKNRGVAIVLAGDATPSWTMMSGGHMLRIQHLFNLLYKMVFNCFKKKKRKCVTIKLCTSKSKCKLYYLAWWNIFALTKGTHGSSIHLCLNTVKIVKTTKKWNTMLC